MEAPPRSAEAATAVAISEAVNNIAPRSGPMESSGVESRRIQPTAKKLRLTCSYGGHIVLRPHDKTLCYVGGETRIIVIDRHASLADLLQRLSRNFMPDESFFLKYQLPSEDLDSLISVATEEDLENMVEEYDRITHGIGGAKLDRLRIFLFPKSASRLQQLLFETESIKTEDYFFSALNGRTTTGVFSLDGDRDRDRELNESSSVNSLLGLHDDCVDNAAAADKDANFQSEAATEIYRNDDSNCVQNNHDVPETPPCFGGSSVPTNSPTLKDGQNAGLLVTEEEPVTLLQPSKTQMSSISSEINIVGDQNNSQILDPGYVISGHQLHQMPPHFYQSNFPPAGPVPMASYFPVYPSLQQHHHPPQQIYLVPARQSSHPLQQSSFSEAATSSSSQKEMADGMYRTVSGGGVQGRYIGFNQVYHQPSQSQIYGSPLPPQFHTLGIVPPNSSGIQQLAKSTDRDYAS